MKDNIERYAQKTPQSGKLYEEALTLLPGGIGGSAPTYDPHPIFVKKAEGSKVWDADGNEFIDFNLCWGVLFVGHSHPNIIAGLRDQLDYGTMFGLPFEEIYTAAKALKDRFPIDKLRFVNSGTEATLYAIRLARRFTGKDKIVKIEGAYHGLFDTLHISKRPTLGEAGPNKRPSPIPYGAGITEGTVKDTLIAPFNDIDAMRDILEAHLGEVAAVIVEPVMMNAGVIPPDKGYLKELRKLTEEYNVLLIFDEVKTGVKLSPGGASEYFDVKPDLISMAKAIGGGLPIGACGGRKEIMSGIGSEGLFGTFSANPLSIRACKITLTEILTKEAYDRVEKLGKMLLSAYDDIISDNKLNATVQGINAVGGILFTKPPVKNYRDWLRADKVKFQEYWLAMANEGILPMAYGPEEEWLVSVQHTEEDIEKHVEAFKKVAPNLRE
ncbi:MAG: aminotransferase class III-fold pyridoxal phosphate-dependent enzyme [Candidatus Thorarchaeota archaeon]|nr:aminotransferase class III-fold pyridoxal phosphate-dependent enzyme [Candidatus Thorarchaeota archaeon]